MRTFGPLVAGLVLGVLVGVATGHPSPRAREGGLSPASMGAALGVSGTNTGDQTKTCSAGSYVSTLAAGTTSTCTAAVTTATAPLVVTGSDVACTAAGAGVSGCLTNSAGKLVVDAGFVNTSTDSSSFAGPLSCTALTATTSGAFGPGGISTDGGVVIESPGTAASKLQFAGSVDGRGVYWGAGATLPWIYALGTGISTRGLWTFDNAFTASQGAIIGSTTFGATINTASGSVAVQTLTGAKTCLGTGGIGCWTYSATTGLTSSVGITGNLTGNVVSATRGTTGLAAFAFNNDGNSGIWGTGVGGTVAFLAAGVSTLESSSTLITTNVPIRIANNPTLATCAAGLEGGIYRDVLSGVATGKRTKLCLCTSDGSSVYAWQNLATGTLGTATTCGTE